MQNMKDGLDQSRTAFFEEVRTLHEAYILSQPASSPGDGENPTDEILSAIASVLGYSYRPREEILSSG